MHSSQLPTKVVLLAALALVACSPLNSDWRAARNADTVEAYQDFLTQHPDSTQAVEARARLRQLAEEADWQQASRLDTEEAYEQFVAEHADSKWAQEARSRSETLQLLQQETAGEAAVAQVAIATGSWVVQLGAFSSRASADAEWQRLRQSHPQQLGQLSVRVVSGAAQNKTIYRLQAGVGVEQRARDICLQLKQRKQDCTPLSG